MSAVGFAIGEQARQAMTFSTTPVVCLTLAKWETVSGQFGGYLRRTDDAFSRRASHASISTLDVRTGRLQWRTALHGRGHHKIEYTLEASLRQMRPRRLGGHDLSPGRLPAH